MNTPWRHQDTSPLGQHLDRLSATTKPVVLAKRRIRSLTGNFYVDGGKVAEVGEVGTLDSDLARAMVKFGRAEYAE
ncbi:MAG TPA: hypothetical protein VEC59_11285 [Steroidobacteraceae bacterium]|nr:hypothetical protein [Steroidobacteraceae bacterium]